MTRQPLYEPPAASARKVLTATALIVREAPSLDSPVLGKLPVGQFVFLIEQRTLDSGTVRALVSQTSYAHHRLAAIGWVTIAKEGRSLLRDDSAVPTIFGPDERFYTSFGPEAAMPLLTLVEHSPRPGNPDCRSARLSARGSARLYGSPQRGGMMGPAMIASAERREEEPSAEDVQAIAKQLL
jgi:hypothetical protein